MIWLIGFAVACAAAWLVVTADLAAERLLHRAGGPR